MKKIFIAFTFFISTIAISQAQEIKPCIADSMEKIELQNHPRFLIKRKELEDFTRHFIGPEQRVHTTPGILYTIPVVFHVMHNYGVENISKQLILDAMVTLNESFQKLNSDTGDVTIPEFVSIFANCQTQFRLATIDPNGNCTDGITRTRTDSTYHGGNNVKSLDDWDNSKYFNIWVVNHIESGAAGYAYKPGATSDDNDGVEILYDYVGGPAIGHYQSRSLAHETGHYLNLPHTWGNTNTPGLSSNCNLDDGIFDTPNCTGSDPSACNLAQNSCGSGPMDTVDNVQNYMDYAACHKMFTEGQKAVMHAALNNGIQYRDNLWQQSNLLATGTEDGHVAQACVPVADFSNKKIYVCEGGSVNFFDQSWHGDITGWHWDFQGATPDTANTKNATVQYNTPGTYDVTLTAYTSAGSNTLVRSALVTVLPATGTYPVPYTESFETINIPGLEWEVENQGSSNAFTVTSAAGASGSLHSVRLVNQTGNAAGNVDALITPTMNLTNTTNTSFTFKYAYASRTINDSSVFKVFVSNNCGQTWIQRISKVAPNFRTVTTPVVTSFVPTSTQWVQQSVILGMNNTPSVRVKFEFTQDEGNNFYIDDINLTGTVGINELLADEYQFGIHPNPSQGTAVLELELDESSNLKIELCDVVGKKVTDVANNIYSPGKQQFEIQNKNYEGVYFVRVNIDNNTFTQKMVFVK